MSFYKKNIVKTLIIATFFLLFFAAIARTHAAPPSTTAGGSTRYTPLVEIKGVTDTATTDTDIGPYIQGAYKWTISLSIALAVIMFTIHAFRYLLSESTITSKQAAKEGMKNVLIGLLLIFSAYLILKTINPQLVVLKLETVQPPKADLSTSGKATCNASQTPPNTNELLVEKSVPCKQTDSWGNASVGAELSYFLPLSGTSDMATCQSEVQTAAYSKANGETYSCVQGKQVWYLVTIEFNTTLRNSYVYYTAPETYSSWNDCDAAAKNSPLTQAEKDQGKVGRQCMNTKPPLEVRVVDMPRCQDLATSITRGGIFREDIQSCQDSAHPYGTQMTVYIEYPGSWAQCSSSFKCSEIAYRFTIQDSLVSNGGAPRYSTITDGKAEPYYSYTINPPADCLAESTKVRKERNASGTWWAEHPQVRPAPDDSSGNPFCVKTSDLLKVR